MSSSGVYGDCHGSWVDERRKPNPSSDRAKRRLIAEQTLDWWSIVHKCSLTLLRVAGIYGPDRLPIERILKGRPIVNPDEAPWNNRIHIDDLTTICIAALNRMGHHEILNVSDGYPSTSGEFISAVATALGMPLPQKISLAEALREASHAERIYLTESRRLDNRQLLEKLDIRLRYPTYMSAMEYLRTKGKSTTTKIIV